MFIASMTVLPFQRQGLRNLAMFIERDRQDYCVAPVIRTLAATMCPIAEPVAQRLGRAAARNGHVGLSDLLDAHSGPGFTRHL